MAIAIIIVACLTLGFSIGFPLGRLREQIECGRMLHEMEKAGWLHPDFVTRLKEEDAVEKDN